MKNSKVLFLLFACLLIISTSISVKGENVRVRIYTSVKITEVNTVASFGSYTIEKTTKINKTDKLNFKVENNKIKVTLNGNALFNKDSVCLGSEDLKCFFQITPTNAKMRRYDNNLIIKLTEDKKNLLLINDVDEDNYLAGVVQSEAGGASDNVEFFKVQAICCRTYMNRFKNKHAKDGYNLCDEVNCQVYFSRANKAQCIEGTTSTSGEIIVDENDKVIETLFHSNSGGQTANSEDVWGNKISYLRSVEDTFSVGGKNYTWEKEIKEKEWLNYFKNKGINIKDYNTKQEILNFSQAEGRKSQIFDIPLTQIRKDFNLKSTFFSVEPWGSNVKLKGKGYGHGVGMSQEGAINMCDQDYDYMEVIEHYYQGVRIKNLND